MLRRRSRRLTQDQADPLLRRGQPLPGAQVERHMPPAGVVDPQPGGHERVPARVRIDTRHLPVPIELPQPDLLRVQRPEAAEDLVPGRLQVQRVQAGRGFHGDLGGHLEQVRDEHVQDRAGGVVELRPVADTERLGHVDLHRLDVLAVQYAADDPLAKRSRCRSWVASLPRKWSIRYTWQGDSYAGTPVTYTVPDQPVRYQ